MDRIYCKYNLVYLDDELMQLKDGMNMHLLHDQKHVNNKMWHDYQS